MIFSLLTWLAGVAPAAGQAFPDKLLGTWTGTMRVYRDGALRDSVVIRLTIDRGNEAGTWKWKTEYLSEKLPMTKDYTLRVVDEARKTYTTDEGGGVGLMDYLFESKLYCVFETHDVMLTSSYEWRDPELIFEVTSGKKVTGTGEVTSYPVINLQRAILKRIP